MGEKGIVEGWLSIDRSRKQMRWSLIRIKLNRFIIYTVLDDLYVITYPSTLHLTWYTYISILSIHLIHHSVCIRPLPLPRPASHSITAEEVCRSMPRQVLYDMLAANCHIPHSMQPKQCLLQVRRNQRRICGKDLAFWRWRRWDPLVSLMAL